MRGACRRLSSGNRCDEQFVEWRSVAKLRFSKRVVVLTRRRRGVRCGCGCWQRPVKPLHRLPTEVVLGIVGDVGPTAFDVASTRYIAFTTFRRNGDPVVTPVWVADLGDGTIGFTTGADSGKVKRLAANAEVRVSPCTMRGVVRAGTPSWRGNARVVRGADFVRVRHAIKRRYHVQLILIDLAARLRRHRTEEVGIVVSFSSGTDRPARS